MHQALFGEQAPDQGEGAVTCVVGRCWQGLFVHPPSVGLDYGTSSQRAGAAASLPAGRQFFKPKTVKNSSLRRFAGGSGRRGSALAQQAGVPRPSAWATMVSRSSNCGRQSSVARMRSTSATSAAGSPARRPRDLDREIAAAHAPHRVDHLEHRRAAAVAAVERRAGAAAAQIGRAPPNARAPDR